MNLFQVLKRPYPVTDGKTYIIRDAVVGGVFVTLFLFLFRPFGMSSADLTGWQMFFICLQYGLVTYVVGLIWGLFILAFPALFDDKHWNVGKEIISVVVFIVLISIANMIFTNMRYGGSLSWTILLIWVRITLSIGIFPIALGVLLQQIRLARKFGNEAQTINQHLHEQHPVEQQDSIVTLYGDNQNEMLTLNIQHLLYLEADDNYVEVVFISDDALTRKVLRAPLKKMEEYLAPWPFFFRCHRAFIVNLQQVDQISGNAQGYKLHLFNCPELIPVSRTLNNIIREKLG